LDLSEEEICFGDEVAVSAPKGRDSGMSGERKKLGGGFWTAVVPQFQ
jgi:hypothetical protein